MNLAGIQATNTKGTMQITIDTSTANALMDQAGVKPCIEQGNRGEYVSFTLPDHPARAEGGKFGVDYLWEHDDAVRWAVERIAAR